MKKNIFKAVIIIGLMAGMTGCSQSESMEDLKVHTQVEVDQVENGVVQEQGDTKIPKITLTERTVIPEIEFNGKTYNSARKMDMLVEDLGLDLSKYDNNVALSEDKTIFALGNLDRFKGMTVSGIRLDEVTGIGDLKALGADILDKDVASLYDTTTFYFDKNDNLETVMVLYK